MGKRISKERLKMKKKIIFGIIIIAVIAIIAYTAATTDFAHLFGEI